MSLDQLQLNKNKDRSRSTKRSSNPEALSRRSRRNSKSKINQSPLLRQPTLRDRNPPTLKPPPDQQDLPGGLGQLRTRRLSPVQRLLQLEPTEIKFVLFPGKTANLKEPLVIHNYNPAPILFTSRSSDINHLLTIPESGIVKRFSADEVDIFYKTQRGVKTNKLVQMKEQIMFEWIKIPENMKFDDAMVLMSDTPKEERHAQSLDAMVIIEPKHSISDARIEKAKSALLGTQAKVTLSGDFENDDVMTNLKLTNNSTVRIIWNVGDKTNILLLVEPHEGLLDSNEEQIITVQTKKFHVGNVNEIKDFVVIEWTAAADDLTEFSKLAIEDCPKIYQIAVKVCYEYQKKQSD